MAPSSCSPSVRGENGFLPRVTRLSAPMEVFDAGFFAPPQAAVGSHDGRPLFVVGMPRSGTTLTEQIIAMHSPPHGCGELSDTPLIVKPLGARWPDTDRD